MSKTPPPPQTNYPSSIASNSSSEQSDRESLRSPPGLGDSWVELNMSTPVGLRSPERVTPLPFASGEEYLRLLREAQKESNQSSHVVSKVNSNNPSPRDTTPKSPPNSPNNERVLHDELRGVLLNYWNKDGKYVCPRENDNWMGAWSSRVDQLPPKDWKFEHPVRHNNYYSMRSVRLGNNSLFSREVMYSLLISNVISLLVGTGLGIWMYKKGMIFRTVMFE